MLKTHEIFNIKGDKGDFGVEINWNDSDDVKDCKLIRLIYKDAKGKQESAVLPREHFHAIMFAIGNPQEQMKLIPQKMVSKRRFSGMVKMKATKDIMKGEEIITTCYHDLPASEEEIVGAVKEGSPIITPKHL